MSFYMPCAVIYYGQSNGLLDNNYERVVDDIFYT